MIEFAEERFTPKIIDELIPMTKAHWDEVRLQNYGLTLNPDWVKYQILQQAGNLRLYTIRYWGELIGYASFIIDTHLHHAGEVFAYCDTLYILPEYRVKTTIPKFFMYFERELRKHNVKVIQIETTPAHKHERFLSKIGYEMNQFISSKRI